MSYSNILEFIATSYLVATKTCRDPKKSIEENRLKSSNLEQEGV